MVSKKKVLVLASTFPRWRDDTVPPFVYNLCKGMVGYEVHVLAPHHAGSATEEVMEGVYVHRYRYAPESCEVLAYAGGILRKVKRSPLAALMLPAFFLGQWWSVLMLHRRYHFGVIHAHWIIPQGCVAALVHRKFLLTSHGGDLYALRSGLMVKLKRWILAKRKPIS